MPDDLTIATPSAAWNKAEPVRKAHRWLMEISRHTRVHEPSYLPREPGEKAAPPTAASPNGGIDPYNVRVARSMLSPDFPMAVWSWVGRVLGEKFAWEVPENLVPIYDNVDRRGNNLRVFLQDVFADLWVQGTPFVLVESTERGGGPPKWIYFDSSAVLRCVKGVNEAGAMVPKRIHLSSPRREGRWGSALADRTWVLLGDGEPSEDPEGKAGPGSGLGAAGARFEFWRKNDREKWVPSDREDEQPGRYEGETEIPGFLFEFGRRDRATDAVIPFTEWLGEVCLHKYAEESDHGKMIRMLRASILYWRGMDQETFKKLYGELFVGPLSLLMGPHESSLETVETTGTSAELSFRELERIEAMVRLASLAPVDPAKVQTLGEKIIDVGLAEASLRASALRLKDGVEELMRITAARLGPGDPGTLQVPTEFSLTVNEEKEVETLLKLLEGVNNRPAISLETFWDKLKSLKFRTLEDIDVKEELARIAKDEDDREKRAAERVRNFAPVGE